MNIFEVEKNIKTILESLNKGTFIYDLLKAYGLPKSSITRLRNGEYNLSKNDDDILWKKRLYFKVVSKDDPHSVIDQVSRDEAILRHQPRFLIITDFTTFLAIDTKTKDTLDCSFDELHKSAGFFGPWAGMEKTQGNHENPADIKAAEKMAKLYDLIRQDNEGAYEDEASLHKLNVFLSRLLFCYFAEDTEIYPHNQFSDTLASYTQDDGSDLQAFLERLFEALNTPPSQGAGDKTQALNFGPREDFPDYLKTFPYVNGGLFAHDIHAPQFTARSRNMLIECGQDLDWSTINPDIFGSMIQAVVHPGQRSTMGMHYTSVTNIMKVIEPLFLNDLKEEFEENKDNESKLKKLLDRLHHIKIFDPACGSGNFLVIAYKELRKLEIDIFEQLQSLRDDLELPMSRIFLNQFYGIELDDFACEVARLSLWLAEHQMNVQFEACFGQSRPSLPLQESGKIVHGNATRLDWEEVCPKENAAEIYILGNPPYQGARKQTKTQKKADFMFDDF